MALEHATRALTKVGENVADSVRYNVLASIHVRWDNHVTTIFERQPNYLLHSSIVMVKLPQRIQTNPASGVRDFCGYSIVRDSRPLPTSGGGWAMLLIQRKASGHPAEVLTIHHERGPDLGPLAKPQDSARRMLSSYVSVGKNNGPRPADLYPSDSTRARYELPYRSYRKRVWKNVKTRALISACIFQGSLARLNNSGHFMRPLPQVNAMNDTLGFPDLEVLLVRRVELAWLLRGTGLKSLFTLRYYSSVSESHFFVQFTRSLHADSRGYCSNKCEDPCSSQIYSARELFSSDAWRHAIQRGGPL
ncbi:hypothetical protein HZH66_006737 [Vespula vulgaris]|uniref:Uncharacterized protein n=1 Tax=Vespula vulgaris TaxID=7454 RepID=A0A834N7R2_VESVU|nr:hypothetical protein HZH66_006737 [Vespula vulgaris]